MKKVTKILIAIGLILMAFSLNAQNNCGVVCHNGRVLAGVNDHAIERHEAHGDTIISRDACDYIETGNECETLSLPKLDFKKVIPIGLNYNIYETSGKLLTSGKTNQEFGKDLPKGLLLFVVVEGYLTKKIIIKQ